MNPYIPEPPQERTGEDDADPYEARLLCEATHRPPTVLVESSKEARDLYLEDYQKDVTFRACWEENNNAPDSWDPASRFLRDDNGLLYFRDADFHARPCVPQSERNNVLRAAHESPLI